MDLVTPKVRSKRGFTVSASKRLLTLKGVGGRMIYRIKQYSWILIVFTIVINLSLSEIRADDTCMFSVTADEVPPNIVLLLDNGAEMQQVQWHSDYTSTDTYTPVPGGLAINGTDDDGDGDIDEADEDDVVQTGRAAAALSLIPTGTAWWSMAAITIWWRFKDDLEPADYTQGLQASSSDTGDGTGVWTINGNP